MRGNFARELQLNLSGLGCWLVSIVAFVLLASAGLGWFANGLLIFLGAIILLPAIALGAASWWVNRNLIEDNCPVCNYQFTGLNGTMSRCPNCGEPLKVENRRFCRLTPEGTIDVEAIEVEPRQIEER